MKALHIPVLGEPNEVEIPDEYPAHLDELQRLVGGDIEYVPTQADVTLFCNENGKHENLPFNEVATRAFGQLLVWPDHFVGDVVIVGPTNAAGDDTELDVEAWRAYVGEWSA